MTDQVKLIHDLNTVNWFYNNILPELKPQESYFLSLSARNKYLTAEEKEIFNLGRNEMFNKQIITERNWNIFLRTLRRMECDNRGYLTKNNLPIPMKTLVCYININPSDSLKALKEFASTIDEYYYEIAMKSKTGSEINSTLNRFNKAPNYFTTCYQKATGTRHWIDFDFDVPKLDVALQKEFIDTLTLKLKQRGVNRICWVDTKSGYHLLVSKEELKFNPVDFVEQAWRLVRILGIVKKEDRYKYEIIYNKNAMIPLPGTFQGGYKVRILQQSLSNEEGEQLYVCN